MKFAAKQFLGFILGACVVLGVQTAFAKQEKVMGELTFKNISVYADGELVDTTGAEPFIYEGTTYLPVRAVASALGKEVNWVGETNTVYLGAMPSAFVETDTLLEDMYSYNNGFQQISHVNKGADNTGAKHESGCLFKCSSSGVENENTVEYSLNGRYSSFSGIIAVPFVDRNNQNVKVVKIYGDDKVLYTSGEMKSGAEPESFDLDVSDVAVLKIEIDGTGQLGIYDAAFYAK